MGIRRAVRLVLELEPEVRTDANVREIVDGRVITEFSTVGTGVPDVETNRTLNRRRMMILVASARLIATLRRYHPRISAKTTSNAHRTSTSAENTSF